MDQHPVDLEHFAYLRSVHRDLISLSGILGTYIERRTYVSAVIETLQRTGRPHDADVATTLLNKLVDQGHVGLMAFYPVTFRPNSSSLEDLDPIDLQVLKQAIQTIESAIKSNFPSLEVVCTGHCSGSEEAVLAIRRADELKAHFAANKVPLNHLRSRAHDPWRRCEVSDHESSFNRRAEIRISCMPRCYSVARARESFERALSLIRR